MIHAGPFGKLRISRKYRSSADQNRLRRFLFRNRRNDRFRIELEDRQPQKIRLKPPARIDDGAGWLHQAQWFHLQPDSRSEPFDHSDTLADAIIDGRCGHHAGKRPKPRGLKIFSPTFEIFGSQHQGISGRKPLSCPGPDQFLNNIFQFLCSPVHCCFLY